MSTEKLNHQGRDLTADKARRETESERARKKDSSNQQHHKPAVPHVNRDNIQTVLLSVENMISVVD